MLKKIWKYIRKKKGSVVIEAALCIPIILYLIFFTIELIRVGVYQIAVDNMALKLAFEYSGLKSSTNFDKVIEKAKPAFFKSMDGVYCRIYIAESLQDLLNSGKIQEDPSWSSSSPSIRNIPDGSSFSAFSGCAIMITVSYKFPFSSEFIKKMFAGGKNYGDDFLLWGRAINVCN
jgi:Flp pilus assembly protein TadG